MRTRNKRALPRDICFHVFWCRVLFLKSRGLSSALKKKLNNQNNPRTPHFGCCFVSFMYQKKHHLNPPKTKPELGAAGHCLESFQRPFPFPPESPNVTYPLFPYTRAVKIDSSKREGLLPKKVPEVGFDKKKNFKVPKKNSKKVPKKVQPCFLPPRKTPFVDRFPPTKGAPLGIVRRLDGMRFHEKGTPRTVDKKSDVFVF